MPANKINIIVKFFLSGIFALVTCLHLYAEGGDSAYIYINQDAQIYGKELLLAKQNTSPKVVKKTTPVKKEEPAPAKNEVKEEEPISVVFPTFPFESSSSSFSQGNSEWGAISPQHKIGGNQQDSKSNKGNTNPDIKNSDLSIYYPGQRQKLSISATQCGVLTSFGAQSPPIPLNPLKGTFYP